MKFLSVCSGIEAASEAWGPLGFEAVGFSEIEPFPAAVLNHHHSSGRPRFMPDPAAPGLSAKDRKARVAAIKAVADLPERANGVPNFGDMTRFEEWPDADFDVLVGGTPCQDFSVAGLRAGMDGIRGSLTLTYAAIARRYRPAWLAWENVPGVLSSNKGRDFAGLLGLLSGHRIEVPAGGWQSAGVVPGIAGAYGLAWRVLDAQYIRVDGFGRAVPQRRRRVFVVGYLGDWRRAAAVLLEPEGMRGDSAPRREAGKGVAGAIGASLAGSGEDAGVTEFLPQSSRVYLPDGVAPALQAVGTRMGNHTPQVLAFGGNDTSGPIDVATARNAHGGPHGRLDFESETFVCAPAVAASLTRGAEISGKGGYAGRWQEDDSNIVAAYSTSGAGYWRDGIGALRAREQDSHENIIAFDTTQITSATNRCNPQPGDACHPLAAGAHPPAIVTSWAVRRLMPVECERLQGFEDGHTAIIFRGKPAADGPRYKSIGNSMAVNVMRWIGMRIQIVARIV